MNRITNNIMVLREKEKLSQEEFAERVGVSRQTIYKWENGLAVPSIENLKKICTLFHCDFKTFCLGEDINSENIAVTTISSETSEEFNKEYEGTMYRASIDDKLEKIQHYLMSHADAIEMDEDDIELLMSHIGNKYFFPEIVMRNLEKFKKEGMPAEQQIEIITRLTELYIDKEIDNDTLNLAKKSDFNTLLIQILKYSIKKQVISINILQQKLSISYIAAICIISLFKKELYISPAEGDINKNIKEDSSDFQWQVTLTEKEFNDKFGELKDYWYKDID